MKFQNYYIKHTAKEKRRQRTNLENQVKILETTLIEDDDLSKYNSIMNEFQGLKRK